MKKEKKLKIAIIGFTTNALTIGRGLRDVLETAGYQVRLDGKSRFISGSIPESHREWTQSRFEDSDVLVFVSSCGIAIRSIAPFIRTKEEDPAVLVVDEGGKLVIPLLSGRLERAEDFAVEIARRLGAVPILTSADDPHHRFAIDLFAKKNHCSVHPVWAAKEASAALLAGEPVGFYSEFEMEGEMPEGLVWIVREPDGSFHPSDLGRSMPAVGIAVTIRSHCAPFRITARVIPEAVWLGVDCKEGKESDAILTFLDMFMMENGIDPRAMAGLAGIAFGNTEPGLLAVVEQYQTNFRSFTSEELEKSADHTVRLLSGKKIEGTGQMCERSAMMASSGRLIASGMSAFGISAAAAVENRRLLYLWK